MSAPEIRFVIKADGAPEAIKALRAIRAEEKLMADEEKKANAERDRAAKSASWGTMKSQLKGVRDLLIPTIGAFSLVTITKDFLGLVSQANAFAGAMGRMAKMTGYSTQELSVWGYMAKRMGKDVEDLQKPLIKSAQFIGQVNLGDKTARGVVGQLFSGNDNALDGMTQDQQLEKITKRMAELGPSAERTTMAMKMFGKSGAELLPFIDKFGKGLDEWKQKAADAGMIVGPELAASISKSKEAMVELKMRSEGVAMQFSAGLMPALAKASMGLVGAASAGGEVGSGFKQLGAIIGFVAKGIVSAFIVVGAVVGTVLAGLWTGLQNYIGRFGRIVEDIKAGNYWQAAKGAMAAGTFGLGKDLVQGLTTSGIWNGFGTQLKKDLSKVWDDSKVDPKLLEEGVVPKLGKEKAAKKVKDWTNEIIAAKKAAGEAEAEANRKIQDELAKTDEEDLKRRFEQGLLTTEEYYRKRLQVIQDAQAAEKKAIADKFGAITGTVAGQDLQGTISGRLGDLNSFQATGETEVQRLKEIAELERLRAELVSQQEKSKREIAANDEASKKALYSDAAKKMADDLEKVKAAKQAELDKLSSGKQDTLTTDTNIATIQSRNMPTLRQDLQAMSDAAVTPEQVKAVQDMTAAFREWGLAVDTTHAALLQFKTSVGELMVSGITDFFMNFATQQKSVGEAALDMAQGFIQAVLQMITQALVMKVVFSAMGLAIPGGSLASAIHFADGGAVQKRAAGGAIFGPGTGTSDSIPAMLSNGEHVWTAEEVRAAGGHREMYALRAAVLSGSRYAEGGAVGDAAGAALAASGESSALLHVGLDLGLVAELVDEHISGPGMKTIIKGTSRHAKGMKAALEGNG